MKTDDIIAKVKATASQAGQAAVKAADKAAKTAERFVETTKLQYQIYELKGEVDALYKEVGKLMHAAHQNKPVEESRIDELLTEIDRKLAGLEDLQEKKARSKNRKLL
jgi:acyl-CoA reductase-like NAD-dependent aldehyde dehydrogenase